MYLGTGDVSPLEARAEAIRTYVWGSDSLPGIPDRLLSASTEWPGLDCCISLAAASQAHWQPKITTVMSLISDLGCTLADADRELLAGSLSTKEANRDLLLLLAPPSWCIPP